MCDFSEGAKTDVGEWLAEDVPPSTDDSENNTTDTDNKKGDRNERNS